MDDPLAYLEKHVKGGLTSERTRGTGRVKNRAPAPVQITAEQILREAKDRQTVEYEAPKQKVTDLQELSEYRLRKRKEFEDRVRSQRHSINVYLKYAAWEESQREFKRARSVFERTIEIDHRAVAVWVKYAEMEMRHKFVNHARNVWDRAVTILPRVDNLWFKYSYMEEMLGNVAGARAIFERWMEWEPQEHAWNAYIKLEQRYGEKERCRGIFERYLRCHPRVKTWIKYAKWEQFSGVFTQARSVFERAIESLGEAATDTLFIAFAAFEEKAQEPERARVIFKYALDHVPKHQAEEVFRAYKSFEKRHGDRDGIEAAVVAQRRFTYEELVREDPTNYDTWFDYVRLEESNGDMERTRDVFERAIANVPPNREEKRFWRRYIYLWIKYALWEELEAADVARARAVYRAALRLVPHGAFSFSKLWLLAAHFEVRQKDMGAARKLFGQAMGRAPKPKIFEAYVDVEKQLGEMERCRTIYGKYVEWDPSNADAWIAYAEFEAELAEVERVRALFDLAIAQEVLDMPEKVWKAYIDFEVEEEEYARARALYEALLARTQHVKVWCSFADFELLAGDAAAARGVYTRAYDALADVEDKEERVMLWEAWHAFEEAHGDDASRAAVAGKKADRVKKTRRVHEDGPLEEYWEYIFPDDKTKNPQFRLLEMARKWKRQKQE